MAAALTVLVVDELTGRPAAGVRVQVYWVEPRGDVLLKAATTDAAGTTAAPLVSGAKLSAGVYRLVLHAGDYLHEAHPDRPRCFDLVPVGFVIDDAATGRAVRVAIAPDGYAVRCG